jgi:hypothetical protein
MPYFRCPDCGLLAHIVWRGPAAVHCSRCRARQREQAERSAASGPPWGARVSRTPTVRAH